MIHAAEGNLQKALEALTTALRSRPKDPVVHYQLGLVFSGLGKTPLAIEHYRAALEIHPNFPEALNNLAWILAANADRAVRNGRESVELAKNACTLTGFKQPQLIGTLAAAYAETGQFELAIATAEQARSIAQQVNEIELARRNGELLELYRSGQAYHDPPSQ